ncbi:hypothetical protein A7U60_g7149 [Sanghuangporus baumii]|uniref:BTB domain-containing protein n=1 Tax=Sanghuangporus baumii TaxID=108892 RepID=A0A9Q5HTN5_SANBA|nr:hypothetical protein A7U60_g7149 [Sanghuangporus baumii]
MESNSGSIQATNQVLRNKRHDTYYIPSGDVVFQVEDTLFRVHRYFFERESALFRDMLSLPAPIQQPSNGTQGQQQAAFQREGTSDENPIRLPQVSKEEFRLFLWVFYNPTHSEYDAPGSKWTSILRLAHLWDFPMIRELAFRQLEKEPPVKRLALADRYDAPPDWRARAMTELVVRREPLSRVEGEELGLETVLKVAEMREKAQTQNWRIRSYESSCRRRRYTRSRSPSPRPTPTPLPASLLVPTPAPVEIPIFPLPPPSPAYDPIIIQPLHEPWVWQQPQAPEETNAEASTSRVRRIFRMFGKVGRM